MEINEHRKDWVDKLWHLGNSLTGYGFAYVVVMLFALTEPKRPAIISVWRGTIVGVIVMGLLLGVSLYWIGRQEILLRREMVGVDNHLSIAIKIMRSRIFVVEAAHLFLICMIWHAHCHP